MTASRSPRRRAPQLVDRPGGTVTLERVAQAAGVSPSTVSRILNGTAVVSQAKKLAVEQAIAQLGFVPNPVARGLAGGRTSSVGVLTQSLDSPFYGVALHGIEDELDKAGYSPLFVSGHWNAAEETRCIEMLRSFGARPDDDLQRAADSGPAGSDRGAGRPDVPYVPRRKL